MKRNAALTQKKLLEGMPYSKARLEEFNIRELKILASLLNINSWQKTKEHLVKRIFKDQHELDLLDERVENFCEMCGHYVANRQDAHIVAEGGRARVNILKLCPSCHLMFDTRLKPRLYEALKSAEVTNIPKSWKKSIYYQAIEASMASPKRKMKKSFK